MEQELGHNIPFNYKDLKAMTEFLYNSGYQATGDAGLIQERLIFGEELNEEELSVASYQCTLHFTEDGHFLHQDSDVEQSQKDVSSF